MAVTIPGTFQVKGVNKDDLPDEAIKNTLILATDTTPFELRAGQGVGFPLAKVGYASGDSPTFENLALTGTLLGVFGATPTTKTTVADLTSYTATGTYGANEQAMLQHLHTKLQAVIDALQSYGHL